MTKSISDKIYSLNVLMIILVVGLHTIGEHPQYRFFRGIVDIAVPVFFVISSYLYFQNFEFSWQCYYKKLCSRFRSLYIPFVLYNALFIPYFYLKVSVIGIENNREVSFYWLDMLTSIFFGIPTVLNGPLWYVQALLLFVILAPILGFFIRQSKYMVLIIIALGTIMAQYYSYFTILHWIPCLALGCHCAFYEEDVIKMIQKIKSISHIKILYGIFIVSYILLCCYVIDDKTYESFIYYCYRIFSPLWIILLYGLFDNLLPRYFVKIVSPYTFFIYCTHTFFIYTVQHFISLYFPQMNIYVYAIVSFIVAFLLVLLSGILISRIKPLWILLSGFRVKNSKFVTKKYSS